MASWIQLGIVAVAAALCPSAAWSGPPDTAENPVAADELRDGLMAALGKEFEYLGGEFGRTKANVGRTKAARFWFARVRPRAAGEFALCCTVRFNFPENPPPALDRRVYLLPIKIGQRSMPRVVLPGSWGGSAYPHANVGDSLVIPIHLDPSGVGHTFTTPTGEDRRVQAFFHVANGLFEHERYMKPAAAMPLVRNQATDWLDLLAGWGESHGSRKIGGRGIHELTAYLEFKQPGEFNLTGRLADADEETTGDEASFRVAPKDKPVTVLLEHLDYLEHFGNSTAGSTGRVEGGTIETRVGDRLVMGCGQYSPRGSDATQAYRQGTIIVRPFKAVEPYTPEPRNEAARQASAGWRERPN